MDINENKRRKLIKLIENEIDEIKTSIIDLTNKIQIKLSSFYQIMDQKNMQDLSLVEDSNLKSKIFQNVISDIHKIEDMVIDSFNSLRSKIEELKE
ncbi:MAG: hypothetical protein ACTSPQ_16615 [Candidatus Helarchaeota archaeon]